MPVVQTSRTSVSVILTALAKERDAFLSRMDGVTADVVRGRPVHRGRLRADPIPGREVVVMCLHEMGNIVSAIAIDQAISTLNPDHVILAGIAGGLQGGAERWLGDVVVGEQIVEYETAKQEASGPKRRYQVYRPAKYLLDQARALSAADWVHAVGVTRPDGQTDRVIPAVHFGVVASGQKVVKDPGLTAELQDDWAKLIAVEMEGAGAAAAIYQNGTQIGFLLVKGICDWADPQKSDEWQEYAANAAAAFVVAVLTRILAHPPAPGPVLVALAASTRAYSGSQKIEVCKRLVQAWPDLADYFEIPPATRAGFKPGREPQGVWEWAEERNRLSELRRALTVLGRPDLVEVLDG